VLAVLHSLLTPVIIETWKGKEKANGMKDSLQFNTPKSFPPENAAWAAVRLAISCATC